MSSEFANNTVLYGDVVGIGVWADGHYRQHLRYNDVLAKRTPPVILPDFPIFWFPLFSGTRKEIRFWLDSHEQWHEQLRPVANITGPNFADLDWTKEAYFYDWIDTHNVEHDLLDRAFGTG